jgi:predicted ArsR family transcriptional regulator
MQKTRQKILEYLKQHGEATVEELSHVLDQLTPVTVRHHLDVLRGEGLVDAPVVQHRTTPGRPRFAYTLTEKADVYFPKNINVLALHMLAELQETLPPEQINVIFDGVAARMAAEIEPGPVGETFEGRLDRVVAHLTDHGYQARWDRSPEGYVLHTSNCPYSGIVDSRQDVCVLDVRYITRLLGTVPRRLTHIQDGGEDCSYLIAQSQMQLTASQ